MFYIFRNNVCIASSDNEPDAEDLKSRGEISVESDTVYDIDSISLVNGEIITTINLDKEKMKKEMVYTKALNDTNYMAINYAEGLYTEEEFAPIKAKRLEWRNAVNAIRSATTIQELQNIDLDTSYEVITNGK